MSEIKAALTAGQWLTWQETDEVDFPNDRGWHAAKFTTEPHRHALAALALHGQPFGFTHEDADNLLYAAQMLDASPDAEEDQRFGDDIRAIAARIRALLPPREEPK